MMLNLPRRITALLSGAMFCSAIVTPPAHALSQGPNPTITGQALATITAMNGTVFKRDFVDWEKEVWGEPAPAALNEKLHEGMQIGTGNNSWAEVAWPNVKTRAWSNTVFAIAPNKRLVYLTGGEMLFRLDKNRKDKDQPYYIWTKVLQARIRGTTVLVQAKGNVTRFTVMEGVVDLYNRLDHSKATLRPGVVYEIVGYKMPNGASGGTDNTSVTDTTPTAFVPKVTKPEHDIVYDYSSKSRLLQDSYASTNLYAANSEALKQHPLVTAGGTLDSLPLIQKEQAELPGYNPLLPIKLADAARLSKVVASGVDVRAVPSNVDYFVGEVVGKTIKLPDSAVHLPPKGVILHLAARQQAQVPPTVAKAPPPIMPLPPGLLIAPAGESTEVFDNPGEPAPVQEFTQGALLAPNQIPGALPANQAIGAAQPVITPTNFAAGNVIAPTNLGGAAATSAAMFVPPMTQISPASTGAFTGVVNTGAVNPAMNVVPSVMNTVPGVTNTITNTAGGLTNTLNNTLQSTLGGTKSFTSGLNLH